VAYLFVPLKRSLEKKGKYPDENLARKHQAQPEQVCPMSHIKGIVYHFKEISVNSLILVLALVPSGWNML